MVGNFAHSSTCTVSAPGGALAGLVPAVVVYVAAQYVKFNHALCDCNAVTSSCVGDLCTYGAQYITQDWAAILAQIDSNSTGFANCMGGRPIIFEMEPDWYQYTYTSQTQPWSAATAGTNMTTLVTRLGAKLPQARFSMDASPWVGPVNGADGGAAWWSNFDMSLFTFMNTSGGGTNAATQQCGGTPSATNPAGAIRCNNYMTWANLNAATGKPILADTGYGAAGTAPGPDPNWDLPANINARIADGVISICQYGPSTTWGATIAGIRSQLNAPKYCP
jgi:hypothetical protein